MDFTGARRYSKDSGNVAAVKFFEWMAEQVIARVHPEQRFDPRTREPIEPESSYVIRNWRLAGYYLGSYLLPVRKKRFPLELESLISGLRQRMEEYEIELQEKGLSATLEAFDVEACDRVESKADKFLKLATHEGTPIEEARAAALALAKLIAANDVALLAWERVRHFSRRFHQMEELFELLQTENPLLFFYGAKGQQKRDL